MRPNGQRRPERTEVENLPGGEERAVDMPDGLLRSTELSRYGHLYNRVHQDRVRRTEFMTTEVIRSHSITADFSTAETIRSEIAHSPLLSSVPLAFPVPP